MWIYYGSALPDFKLTQIEHLDFSSCKLKDKTNKVYNLNTYKQSSISHFFRYPVPAWNSNSRISSQKVTERERESNLLTTHIQGVQIIPYFRFQI